MDDKDEDNVMMIQQYAGGQRFPIEISQPVQLP